MRTFSGGFREALRGIRELNSVITYQSPLSYHLLMTETDDELLTELSDNLATERGDLVYDKESLNSVIPAFNVDMLKTVCKSIQIDCNNCMDYHTWLNAKIGVKVGASYEYMDFGNFYINDKPIFKADTNSYLVTAYDKMIQSMVKYDDMPLDITYPITHKNLILAICDKLLWENELIDYPNFDKLISSDLYSGQSMTYRDILDDLCVATGGNLLFNLNDKLVYKQPTETGEIVDDFDLKDENVNIGNKYGKVNAITITVDNDNVLNTIVDDISITENGKTEININDNKLLTAYSDLFIDDLFTAINGLEFYTFDIDTTGLLIFEPLDRFTINHDDINYSCVMFNNIIEVSQGLVENAFAEMPTIAETEFTAQVPIEKDLKNAVININKAKGQIVLKADSNGNMVQVELNADADNGSEFNVKADNINFESTTFNLDTDNISIVSDTLRIDDAGILVKAGNYSIIEDELECSIINTDNLINDHNFELLQTSGSIYPTYFDFEIDQTYATNYDWRVSGLPKMISTRNSGLLFSEAKSGYQCVVCNDTNKLFQEILSGDNQQMFISLYAGLGYRSVGKIARITVEYWQYNVLGDILVDSETHDIEITEGFFKWKRIGFPITTPVYPTASGMYANTVKIILESTDTNYIYYDCVQVVKGQIPQLYVSDLMMWKHIRKDLDIYRHEIYPD